MRFIPHLPRAWQWDHNAHYHDLLLRALPQRMERALDVGCGTGVFARKLASRADNVDAIDRSARMIEYAKAESSPVRWLLGDVLQDSPSLHPEGYDAVTAISSVHHMPLRPALTRLAELVRPGGTLAIVGIPHVKSARDYAIDVVAIPANGVVGAMLALQGKAGKGHDIGIPMMDPTTTLADIRTAAAALVPDAVVRRHLFWRYSLVWHKPA